MDINTKNLIKAYFEGGNAKSITAPGVLKQMLLTIEEVVEREEEGGEE